MPITATPTTRTTTRQPMATFFMCLTILLERRSYTPRRPLLPTENRLTNLSAHADPPDVLFVEARFSQHFAGVLSELRSAPLDEGRRLGNLDRRAERPHAAKRRVVELHHHLPRLDLRIGEGLGIAVDRSTWNAVSLERRQPVGLRLRCRHLFDPCDERGAVRDARGRVGELRHRGPFRMPEQR